MHSQQAAPPSARLAASPGAFLRRQVAPNLILDEDDESSSDDDAGAAQSMRDPQTRHLRSLATATPPAATDAEMARDAAGSTPPDATRPASRRDTAGASGIAPTQSQPPIAPTQSQPPIAPTQSQPLTDEDREAAARGAAAALEEFGALAFSPRATRGQRRAREAATALAATRAAAAVVERTAAGRATAAVRGTLESQLGEDDEEEADWRTRARERDGERAEAEKTTPPPAGILGSVFQTARGLIGRVVGGGGGGATMDKNAEEAKARAAVTTATSGPATPTDGFVDVEDAPAFAATERKRRREWDRIGEFAEHRRPGNDAANAVATETVATETVAEDAVEARGEPRRRSSPELMRVEDAAATAAETAANAPEALAENPRRASVFGDQGGDVEPPRESFVPAADVVGARFSGKKRTSSGATPGTAAAATTPAERRETPAERRETPTELHRGTPTLAAGLVGARFSGKKRKSTGEATPRIAAMPPPPTMTKTPASNRGTPTVAAELVGARFSGKRRASGNAGSGRALKGVAALVDVEGAGTSPGAAAALVASRFSGKKRESSGANATTIPVEGGEGGIPTTMTKTPASNRGTPTLAAELVGARFSGKRRKSSLADANAAGAVSPGATRPSPRGLAALLRPEDDPADPFVPAKKVHSDDPAPRLPAKKSRRKPKAPASIYGVGAKSNDGVKSAAEARTETENAANAAAAEEARVVAEAAAARASTPATAPLDPRGTRFDDDAEDAPDESLRPAAVFAKLGVAVFGSGRKSHASRSTPRARTPQTAGEKWKPSGRTAMSLLGL